MIVDRAGLVGQDGETHQGIFDISFMSAMPNITIIAPKDTKELIEAMKFAVDFQGPLVIRFPRGNAYVSENTDDEEFKTKKSPFIKKGKDIAVITVGNMFEETQKALELLEKERVFPTLVNARFIKPIDCRMIEKIAEEHKAIVVVEEAIKKGGYGESVETYVHEKGLNTAVHTMAIDDRFVEQGQISDLRERLGISYRHIYEKVLELTK